MSSQGHALVVGATGISGGNVATRLLADGLRVSGLSRRPAEGGAVEPTSSAGPSLSGR